MTYTIPTPSTVSAGDTFPASAYNIISNDIQDHESRIKTGVESYTTTQKNALTGVTTGTMVYDSTLGLFQYWNGSAWTTMIDTTVVALPNSITQAVNLTATYISAGNQRVLNVASSGCYVAVDTTTPSTIGNTIDLVGYGTSALVIKGNAGVTINGVAGSGNNTVISGILGWVCSRYMTHRLTAVATNTWVLNYSPLPSTSILT